MASMTIILYFKIAAESYYRWVLSDFACPK
jgi:hypothetical protein